MEVRAVGKFVLFVLSEQSLDKKKTKSCLFIHRSPFEDLSVSAFVSVSLLLFFASAEFQDGLCLPLTEAPLQSPLGVLSFSAGLDCTGSR